MGFERATYGVWIAWVLSWYVAALWASRAAARPKPSLREFHRVLATLGIVLLLWVASRPGGVGWWIPASVPLSGLSKAVADEPTGLQAVLLAATVASFGFCWWARLHMGRLWSGFITVKAEHRIVDTGPFRLVRHPIYAGLMGAAVAMALLKLSPLAGIAALLVIVGFSITARLEERFLREELGADVYDPYRRRTAMLVPGLRIGAR
ncbi:MAG TPA: isoprenylcysteine carboxylmethyltransferase family protein [Caulobacteraceae bacterium]